MNRNIHIVTQFKKGLNIAYSSFAVLWENKKLLIYLGIPILAGTLIEILAYNLQAGTCCISVSLSQKGAIARILKFSDSYNWLRYISLILLYFMYLAILTFEGMALTYHAWKIKNKEPIGVRKTFKACVPKIKNVLTWTVCILVPIVTFYILNARIQKTSSAFLPFFYALTLFLIFASWSLITAFVVQAIAIEHLSVMPAIKKSFYTIKHIFFEYLGTIFWIGLISTISAIPFIILEKYLHNLYLISIPLVLLTYCAITSAYTVAKTLLYMGVKK